MDTVSKNNYDLRATMLFVLCNFEMEFVYNMFNNYDKYVDILKKESISFDLMTKAEFEHAKKFYDDNAEKEDLGVLETSAYMKDNVFKNILELSESLKYYRDFDLIFKGNFYERALGAFKQFTKEKLEHAE